MFKHIVQAMLLALILALGACDGSFNTSPEGAVQDASVRDIFRGLASSRGEFQEDRDKENARKGLYELIATKAGVNLDKAFLATLQANPHFGSIEVKSASLGAGDESLVLIAVRFVVDGHATAQMNFLSPQKPFLGPIRMSKLPMLDSVQVVAAGRALLANQGNEFLLTSILNQDQNDFSRRISEALRASKVRNRTSDTPAGGK
jgi:hypothetical protein